MFQEQVLSPDVPTPSRKQNRDCIHERFELQAIQTPGAVALKCGGECLSYAELNHRANQLAWRLRSLGVRAETPVVLYLDRSLEMVIAILGVLKAGGVYVPIDLSYPRDRARFMLEDTRAALVVTQSKLRSQLPDEPGRVICLDSDWAEIAACPGVNPDSGVTPHNAAYIIYTSGSTGKPKGVVVTHHNVVRLLDQTRHWYGFDSRDVWPLFHSYAFDVSVWELWGALFNGGRLVIVPYLVTRSPGEFYQLLAREKVTVLNQTPSAFRQLIWAESNAPEPLDLSLRYVICAGEALELQSLKPWFDRHGDECPRIVNMYGITETTVHSTYRVIRQSDLSSGLGSVIGAPIPDLRIYLVDEELNPVPAGVPGEICVGGEGVARGYLNRPELTAQRFMSDPFSLEPGARMYRSGDLARYTEKGELEYLGRMDHQVKIRGFRVELGEIESGLNSHPAVRESVVIARDLPTGDKQLVGYIVPVSHPPTVSELREHLLRRIPDYMVPAAFVPLPALPLTTNGKADRRALPAPGAARPALNSEYVAPRNSAEAALCRIWSDVLEIEAVGVDDNFFELGGDSIRGIRILARAQQEGLNLTLQQVFERPTVAGLAACAKASTAPRPTVSSEPFSLISPADRAKLPADAEDAYPIAKLQLGMFFRNELDPESAMYHDVFSYRVRSGFDRAKIERSINRLAARHPILRTSFHLADFSEPVQIVHRLVSIPCTIEDLRDLPAAEREARIVTWIEGEKRRPFDRSVPPMARFHAQLLTDGSFQFFISFHHSCLDGWSLAAVVTEIFQDYAASPGESAPFFAPPSVSYGDFVRLERESTNSAAFREFWSAKIRDLSPGILPRWPASFCEGGREQKRGPELPIPDDVLTGLRALAARAGVPLKSVLLAAHQRVMGFLYGQADVVSGLISNGRPEEGDGDRVLGLFLNAVPVRMRLEGGSWIDLVRQTFEAERELIPYRRFPLSEIQKLNGGGKVLETAFDFVHFHVLNRLEGLRDFELREGPYFEANDMATYTTFMLDAASTRLELHIDYDPNVIARRQIEEISQYYLAVLRVMAARPDSAHESFLPLSDPEKRRMLIEWNDTRRDYPDTWGIHELFEARAGAAPEAVAVCCGGERLTYRELNERADRLAARLRSLAGGAVELVGICVDRSPAMLTGLLGILKAGAAYVPLDPSYPRERLAQMIEGARLRWVVGEKASVAALPPSEAKVVLLDGLELPTGLNEAGRSEMAKPRPPAAGSLAYVIFTSGSTGKPKGVAVEHRSVINLLTSIAQTAGVTSRDHVLAVTTLSFDIAALELFLPLILGGRVTLAPREVAADGEALGRLMAASGATVMQATPATWRLLIESGWTGDKRLRVFCGGEALKRSLADELLARAGEVWNVYGPTETTIWSTAWKVVPGVPISIGRPLANTRLYILDERGRPVPIGTAGELHIAGDGVARGYLGLPELTAQRFVVEPFHSDPAARMYKTGDLARYLPDGNVECLGRTDHQVKVRGFRIELGEVEAVLRQHAGIADALVTARDNPLGEKQLVGYVISRNGPPSQAELRDFVKSKLPIHMVPAHLVPIKQFPLTPNGKVDFQRLPAPETGLPGSRARVTPRNDTERGVAEIWKEVLALDGFGVDDNFFDLGGDSLSATRLFARLNQVFGIDLKLHQVFENPTLGALAGVIHQLKHASTTGNRPIPKLPRA
jgi:amino acid adenylation domain-containing protein